MIEDIDLNSWGNTIRDDADDFLELAGRSIRYMNSRNKRINAAILRAKKRDNYRCRVCGRGSDHEQIVEGAHILPRNVAFPWYHPDDEEWIVTLCRGHHESYDSNHSAYAKVRWLHDHNLVNEALRLEIVLNCGMP